MAVAAIKMNGSATPQVALAVGTVVTLSNNSDTGVTTWLWEIIDQPVGSVAALATPTTSTCAITLDLEGSYLFRLTLNAAGTPVVSTGLAAVPQTLSGQRVPAAFERLEAGARGSATAQLAMLNALEDRSHRGVVVAAKSSGALAAGVPVYVAGQTTLANGMKVPIVTLAKADTTATLPVFGICLDTVGSAGQVRVRVQGALTEIVVNTAGKSIGDPVYVSDTGTLAFTAGTIRAIAGYVTVANATGYVYVTGGIDGHASLDLASVASGKGASLVGVQDSAGYLAAVNVETALAEIFKYIPTAVADPGGANQAIPVTKSATIAITTAGAETNTLADPAFVGQLLVLTMDTRVSGDRVITAASAINQANQTIMTFGAVRDTIALRCVTVGGARKWEVMGNDGVALS